MNVLENVPPHGLLWQSMLDCHADPLHEKWVFEAHPDFPDTPVVPEDVAVIQRTLSGAWQMVSCLRSGQSRRVYFGAEIVR